MKRPWAIVLILSGFATAGLLVFAFTGEPSTDGRPLSAWLRLGNQNRINGNWRPAETGEINPDDAVGKIGVKAIPWLLKKMRAQDPAWKAKLSDVLAKQSLIQVELMPAWFHREEAAYGFSVLNTKAVSALPELQSLLFDPDAVGAAARAMGSLGPDGWTVLRNILMNDTNAARRWAALDGLTMARTAESLRPELLQLRHDPDGPIAAAATSLLLRSTTNGAVFQIAREALADGRLRLITATVAFIRQQGSNAIALAPLLPPLLDHPDRTVRNRATNALKFVDPSLAFIHGISTNRPPPATNFPGRRGGGRDGPPKAPPAAP